MTKTEQVLQKMLINPHLKSIESSLTKIKHNLQAHEMILSRSHKLKPALLRNTEEKYKLDMKKYQTAMLIYAVVKCIEDEDLQQHILIQNPPYKLMDSVEDELYGTSIYDRVMDEYNELLDDEQVHNYNKYFQQ